jgi:hypothetical protein
MATVGLALRSDGLAAAREIIQEGERKGVPLRLFGGLAFKAICSSAKEPGFSRPNKDIDLFGRRQDAKKIVGIMRSLGYKPREMFNSLSMGKRLIYHDTEMMRRIDIFLDDFEMCHKFDFRQGLSNPGLTLPLTDLVMSKLQVVEITDKEYKDLLAAFRDFGAAADESAINVVRLAEICSKDWGVYKTFTTNLKLLRERALLLGSIHSAPIVAAIDKTLSSIERREKTLAWRLRSKIGEKARWYELPDSDADRFA